MRVIGVGFARTGTTSLKAALEILGLGPCYHMMDVMAEPRRIQQWLAIGRGAPPDWRQIFSGYQSAVDWPVAAYWRELAAAFPEAALVLTVRDPQSWYDSVRRTIFRQVIETPRGIRTLTFRLLRAFSPNLRAFLAMTEACIQQPIFNGRLTDRQYATSIFDKHIEEVRAAFPPERLLVFRASDGWEPLCAFLGMPVPDRPFPHENTSEAFGRTVGPLIGRLALGPLARKPSRT